MLIAVLRYAASDVATDSEASQEGQDRVDSWSMGSTLRTDVSKALLLERLLRSWEKRSDLTLGRLVVEAVGDLDLLSRLTDRELAEAVERYVLLA